MIARTYTLALLMIVAVSRVAGAADPVEVFVDARDPAFVVVQGIADNTSDLARREMAGYATLDGVSLVAWSTFRQNAPSLIAPHVIKDEYAQASTVLGLVALVKAYPGRSFAVTWNGGLAVTFQDYQYAVSGLKAFVEDAAAYEQARARAVDPLNPQNHLAALLNR